MSSNRYTAKAIKRVVLTLALSLFVSSISFSEELPKEGVIAIDTYLEEFNIVPNELSNEELLRFIVILINSSFVGDNAAREVIVRDFSENLDIVVKQVTAAQADIIGLQRKIQSIERSSQSSSSDYIAQLNKDTTARLRRTEIDSELQDLNSRVSQICNQLQMVNQYQFNCM